VNDPPKLDTMWEPGHAEGPVRLHVGLSTGAKTPEGIERIRRVATQHGRYAQAMKALEREADLRGAGAGRLVAVHVLMCGLVSNVGRSIEFLDTTPS
jgi:hypothetical protein